MQPEFNLRGVFTTGLQGVRHRSAPSGLQGYTMPCGCGPVGQLAQRLGLGLRRSRGPHYSHCRAEGVPDAEQRNCLRRRDPALSGRDPRFSRVQPELLTDFKPDAGLSRQLPLLFWFARKPAPEHTDALPLLF